MQNNPSAIDNLLERIQNLFYKNTHQKCFFEDKRVLSYALTWPATWLQQRGLTVSQQRYEKIINEQIDDIVAFGLQERYQQYFPRYLLKCIQQWFIHNGDQLCDELRHVRNKLWQADHIIEALQKPPNASSQTEYAHIDAMVKAHLILKAHTRHKTNQNHKQLTLL